MTRDGTLCLRLFGNLAARRDGRALALPRSKKTRALLAYLVVTARPHRRDRLCSLFWEIPDDPRAALRWSLSKLRPLVDEPDRPRIVADRETVTLDLAGAEVDLYIARTLLADGLENAATEQIKATADAIGSEFLADLDLPNLHDYQAWLTAERDEANALQITLLAGLVDRLAASPGEALSYARLAAELDPDDERARATLFNLQAAKTSERRQGKPLAGVEPVPNRHSAAAGATRSVTGGLAEVIAETSDSRKVPHDRPSIAVLPFTNMSDDPNDEYFSDGITEDLITELSRFRPLRVIARNSSFTYKGVSVRAQDVGRDLGVEYMVEGSVRRSGGLVRISAQLVETDSGEHLWAERYDRDLEDIFALQDEIAQTIAAAVEPELGNVERERSRRKPAASLTAWDWYQRGAWCMYQDTETTDAEAILHCERAIALSPDFAPPYALQSLVLLQGIINGHIEQIDKSIEDAHRLAVRAVALDDKDAFAHMVLGRVNLLQCRHEDSVAELETAVTLNPSFVDGHHYLGFSLIFSGQPDAAVPLFDTAIRLSPFDPRISSFFEMRAWALLVQGHFEEAAASARMSVRRPNASHWAFATLSAALGHLGCLDEAGTARDEVLKRKPDFSVGFVNRFVYYNKRPADLEIYIAGLRKAGMPE